MTQGDLVLESAVQPCQIRVGRAKRTGVRKISHSCYDLACINFLLMKFTMERLSRFEMLKMNDKMA